MSESLTVATPIQLPLWKRLIGLFRPVWLRAQESAALTAHVSRQGGRAISYDVVRNVTRGLTRFAAIYGLEALISASGWFIACLNGADQSDAFRLSLDMVGLVGVDYRRLREQVQVSGRVNLELLARMLVIVLDAPSATWLTRMLAFEAATTARARERNPALVGDLPFVFEFEELTAFAMESNGNRLRPSAVRLRGLLFYAVRAHGWQVLQLAADDLVEEMRRMQRVPMAEELARLVSREPTDEDERLLVLDDISYIVNLVFGGDVRVWVSRLKLRCAAPTVTCAPWGEPVPEHAAHAAGREFARMLTSLDRDGFERRFCQREDATGYHGRRLAELRAPVADVQPSAGSEEAK